MRRQRSVIVASVVAVRRTYPSLAGVERLALWWWAAIGAIGGIGLFATVDLAIGFAGFLMIGLGVFVAANGRGIADKLSRRRTDIGPFWQQQSAASWRFSGAVLTLIGGGWLLFAFG